MPDNTFEDHYSKLLETVYRYGTDTPDRTSVGMSRQLFGTLTIHNYEHKNNTILAPFTQLRTFAPRIAFEEWKWMMRGSTNVRELQDKNIHIWDGNSTRAFLDSRGLYTTPEHTIGKAYGYQFRHLPGNDQLANLVDGLITNPTSRRHMINLWNPTDLKDMALEPCAYLYNFVVINNKLNLMQHMRSADIVFGLPYNSAFGAFFLLFLSKLTGIPVGEHMITMANAHIYENQFPIVEEMLELPIPTTVPKLTLNKEITSLSDLDTLEFTDFTITDFVRGPKIGNATMAI